MAAVLTPDGRGQVTAPGAIPRRSPETATSGESEPVGTGSSPQHRTDPTCETMMSSDQTSVWLHCDDTEAELQEEKRADRNLRHVFLSKTVHTLTYTHTHTHTHTHLHTHTHTYTTQ